jgi:peptide/nickel transport system substrate-binding protein
MLYSSSARTIYTRQITPESESLEMHSYKKVLVILALILSVLPFAHAQDEQPQAGGTLTVALTDEFTTLNPTQFVSLSDIHLTRAIYEPLFRIDHNDPTLPLVPHLAESYTISEDGLTWTINVRQGVYFHHGKELNADDVVFTLERAKDPTISYGVGGLQFLESVEKLDTYVVKLNLNQPHFLFAQALEAPFYGIIPSDRTEEQLATEPSGTGAFKLQEYSASEKAVLVKNENYWVEGLPYLDELILRIIPDRKTQIAALVSGEVDAVSDVGALDLPILNTQPGIVVEQTAPFNVSPVLVANTTLAPFDDVRVIKAIKMALDRQILANLIGGGVATPSGDNLIPPGHPLSANIPVPQQDIEGARALLAEAGYPDGIEITLVTSPVAYGAVELAVAVQEMVAPAGITITLERVDPGMYWTTQYMQVPFFISSWNAANVMGVIPQMYLSTSYYNEAQCCGEISDNLVYSIFAAQTDEERALAVAEFQMFVNENGGHIIPFIAPYITAKRDNVVGEPNNYFTTRYETNWVK